MRRRELGLAILILSLAVAGCGARVIHVIADDEGPGDDAGTDVHDGSPEASLDDVWMDPACGTIDRIPPGQVRVGTWSYEPTTKTFTLPDTCSVVEMVGNRVLSLSEFWLDTLPTTNLCYSECVKRGVCTPPEHDRADPDPHSWLDDEKAGKPVYVTHEQAATFCAWRGGYLPSLAQLARAAQGDGDIPGVAALTEDAIRCHEDEGADEEACRLVELITIPPSEPYPVGRADYDLGPFGTRDIHGSVTEWTRTYYVAGSAEFCALSDGSPDFVSFAPSDGSNSQYVVVGYAANIQHALTHPFRRFRHGLWSAAEARYDVGFRCAYGAALPDSPAH